MITLELDFLEAPNQLSLMYTLKSSMSTPDKITRQDAYKAIAAYDALCENMRIMLEAAIKKNPEANFDSVSILLDSVYLPQLLGLLFPRNSHDLPLESLGTWPILVLQSEHFFIDRLAAFQEAIMPFLHPNNTTRPAIVPNAATILRNLNINSNKGHYSHLSILTQGTKTRLVQFFEDFNRLLVVFLYHLQQSGRVSVIPPLQTDHDRWWKRHPLP
jgi:hypothetical protein